MRIGHSKVIYRVVFIIVILLATSCGSTKLVTTSVSYQSVRPDPFINIISPDAKIAVGYAIDMSGTFVVEVTNMTDEIMIIDQTKSFYIDPSGKSISYFDPTVRVQSTTNTTSSSVGAGVNLGAVAGALGVGGIARTALNGVNVGSSKTNGVSQTNTTLFADEPYISLGPKSNGLMSKKYKIYSLLGSTSETTTFFNRIYDKSNSCLKFSVCISFSIDGGKNYDKIVTDFYVNQKITSPVIEHGKVNDALRKIFEQKSDAIYEPYWQLDINSNHSSSSSHIGNGYFLNCK